MPSRWPTILVTFFFGPFGLIPAANAAHTAESRGRYAGRYWTTFFVTFLFSCFAWFLAYMVVFGGLVAAIVGWRNSGGPTAVAPVAPVTTTSVPTSASPIQGTSASSEPTSTTPSPSLTPRASTSASGPSIGPASAVSHAAQWPDYDYIGSDDLCRVSTFPAAGLLRAGASDEAVTSAQYALLAMAYDTVSVTGTMDAATVAALKQFQSNHKLIADGTLGQQTWTALGQRLHYWGKCQSR